MPCNRQAVVVVSSRSGMILSVCRDMRLVAVNESGRRPPGFMTEAEFDAKLAEVDRLLNDPEVRLDPDRVWTLLAELSSAATPTQPPLHPITLGR